MNACLRSLAVIAAMILGGTASAAGPERWSLALSWSPQYCRDNLSSKEPQCTEEHYFVVHALMPNSASGLELECEPGERPIDDQIDRLMPLTFNREEIRRRWRRQADCIGLPFEEYAVQLDYAARRVTVPKQYDRVRESLKTTSAEVKEAFVKANPGLQADNVALQCTRGWLKQVSICFNADMSYRECGPDSVDNCKRKLKIRSIPRSKIVEQKD